MFWSSIKVRDNQKFFAYYRQILQNDSLRSMAVLSSRAHERRSREIRTQSARERAAKPREKEKGFSVAPAPISSRFFCPRPPLLLSNQNRHATQANKMTSYTWNFQNFTCVFTIFVKFDIYFLELPWEIVFGVITDN